MIKPYKKLKDIISVKILFYIIQTPHGVVANMFDYDIKLKAFKLQSRYHVPFQTYGLGKSMKHLILQAMG